MSCCGCHAFANVARKAQVGRQEPKNRHLGAACSVAGALSEETLVDQLAAFGALGAGMERFLRTSFQHRILRKT